MKSSNNTILITGGSAGIGFALAKLFSSRGNRVIITGRNEKRLRAAAAQLPNTTAIAGDVSNPADAEKLAAILRRDHADLNIVINNAGIVHVYNLIGEGTDTTGKASEEMLTNYLSVVRLNELLIPLLKKQPAAAIFNVSSIVAITPAAGIATYSASKAALHFYTLALRHKLAQSSDVKVFELMPPLVDTEFSAEIGGQNGIAPSVVAEALVEALEKDEYEIHVGQTENIYQLALSSPEKAFQAMNVVRERLTF
jgi:uncharacterized oxidoreductase